MKETHIDRIIACSYSNREQTQKNMAEALSLMVKPMLEALEKPEHTETVCSQMAEQLMPLAEQVNRESYAKFYTEEQLSRLADFYEANPWYHVINGDCAVWTSNEISQRSRPFVEAILNKYTEEDDEPARAITDGKEIPQELQ